MKYMISWFERPQGSPAEYENAQKRILDVFGQMDQSTLMPRPVHLAV